MKNLTIRILMLLACIGGVNVSADNTPPTADVNMLKAKIAPYRKQIDAGTTTARSLQLKLRGTSANGQIDYDQCKAIEKKIEAQYPLSPFTAFYQDGSSFSQGCEWDEAHPSKDQSIQSEMKYYFEKAAYDSQLGLHGVYVLRIEKPNGYGLSSGPSEGEYLLDANFKIIERSWVSDGEHGPTAIGDVLAIDKTGDGYVHFFDGPLDGKSLNFERMFYLSSDGRLYSGVVFRSRRSDRGSENVIVKLLRVSQKDWLQNALIPTFLWFGQFFQYKPKQWVTRTNVYDWLTETSIAESGQEVCADGESTNGASWVSYKPSNNQDPWYCFNAW